MLLRKFNTGRKMRTKLENYGNRDNLPIKKKCHDLNYPSYPMLEDKGFGESKKVRFRSREQGCLTRRVKRGREGQLPVLLCLVSDMLSVISDAIFYTSSSGYVYHN